MFWKNLLPFCYPVSFFYSENADNRFFQYISSYLLDHMTSSSRWQFTNSLIWEPHISHYSLKTQIIIWVYLLNQYISPCKGKCVFFNLCIPRVYSQINVHSVLPWFLHITICDAVTACLIWMCFFKLLFILVRYGQNGHKICGSFPHSWRIWLWRFL